MNLIQYLIFRKTKFFYKVEPDIKVVFVFVRAGYPIPQKESEVLEEHIQKSGYIIMLTVVR